MENDFKYSSGIASAVVAEVVFPRNKLVNAPGRFKLDNEKALAAAPAALPPKISLVAFIPSSKGLLVFVELLDIVFIVVFVGTSNGFLLLDLRIFMLGGASASKGLVLFALPNVFISSMLAEVANGLGGFIILLAFRMSVVVLDENGFVLELLLEVAKDALGGNCLLPLALAVFLGSSNGFVLPLLVATKGLFVVWVALAVLARVLANGLVLLLTLPFRSGTSESRNGFVSVVNFLSEELLLLLPFTSFRMVLVVAVVVLLLILLFGSLLMSSPSSNGLTGGMVKVK